MLRSARELDGDRTLHADLCVVGTGAGGAMVAREAARAGLKVIAIEEGPHSTPKDFTQREDEMLPRLFQDAGARATDDGAIQVLQGRGVGGSTVHNTNLCKRAPAEVLDRWRIPGWSAAELAPHYAVVERDLHVSPLVETDLNRNNALLKRGVEKLGWKGGLLSHNRRNCARSGFCELGCSFDAKENALKILVPEAIAAGAEVWTELKVERVLVERRRAVGVEARARDGKRLRVHAAVCLAGSAIGSAQLALKSELPDPAVIAGASLRMHPGGAVAGIFDEPVEGWTGIPQSYECTEKLSYDEGSDDRTWIVPAFAHPIGLSAALPGFGAAHMKRMREYPRLAIFVAMLHDRTAGRVTVDGGRLHVRYELEQSDQRALLSGLRACAELMFAAGARRVVVPFLSPIELDSPTKLDEITRRGYRPLDPLLTAVHPMGTLPLGKVVDEFGAWRGLGALWVADGSLFPTSIGGPPQLTIYAAAHKVAGHIVGALS
jgi:choline dehydrogenase-like flavoprotein